VNADLHSFFVSSNKRNEIHHNNKTEISGSSETIKVLGGMERQSPALPKEGTSNIAAMKSIPSGLLVRFTLINPEPVSGQGMGFSVNLGICGCSATASMMLK
jgi:hypothetical protein